MVNTLIPALSNYFLDPSGLLALTALLPLAIFYLVRRKPEKKTMPSMMFFRSEEDMESTSQAYRKLARNLLLLLHILMIAVFAAAFAKPFISGAATPESATLILDRSASMEEDFQQAKEFLQSRTGEKNTVIMVDDEARTVAEGVSKEKAREIIDRAERKGTATDIVSGLEAARGAKNLVIGSDLDQSVNRREVEPILESFRNEGANLEIIETGKENSWGITGIEAGRNTTKVELKNFKNSSVKIQLNAATTRQVEIAGKSIEQVTVESKTGRNTVRLPGDGFKPDNKAYFFVPEQKNFTVTYIADERNPYLAKVFEIIEFTAFNYRKPPVEEELKGDIYIVGETDSILAETVREIESEVRNGGNMVLFGTQDLSDLGFSDLPVQDRGETINASVTIKEPSRISVGSTNIRDVEKLRGERYSAGNNAIIRAGYGSGEMLLYNLEDKDFNRDFLYPVFWKEIASEMVERRSISDTNYRTGEEIESQRITTPDGETVSGRQKLDEQGFYNTSEGIVAVNMFNQDEMLRDEVSTASRNDPSKESSKKPMQNLAILLVLLLSLGEIGYLYRIGDFR